MELIPVSDQKVDGLAELESLEEIIEKGLTSFFEVGKALITIKEKELYLIEYKSFEEYYRARWGFKRTYAHYLIEATKVMDDVHNCERVPTCEAQARPLTKLAPEKRRDAWMKAVSSAPDGKVTAAHVVQVVREMTAPPAPREVESKPKKEKDDTPETYSSGLIYVEYAISQMERIHRKDTQRRAAWARMRQWLDEHEAAA